MPVYQFFCDECFDPYEIQMKIKKLEEYDRHEDLQIKCPKCNNPLRKLMCPPKIIKIN